MRPASTPGTETAKTDSKAVSYGENACPEMVRPLASLAMIRCGTSMVIGSVIGSLLITVATAKAEESSTTRIESILLDGAPARLVSGKALRVPSRTRDVEIRFGAALPRGDGVRLRYRLKGFDSEWQDPRAEMRAVVHFVDAAGVEVGASQSLIRGTSDNWRYAAEVSGFDVRTVEAVVPSRAARGFLEFVSGGAASALGVYAFREVQCELTASNGQSRHFDFSMEVGVDLANATGVPAGWQRVGSKPEMAEVLPVNAALSSPGLVLRDANTDAYCGWRLAPPRWFAVQAGEQVRVHWRECYSIGAGGRAVARYRYLRPGAYRFEMQVAKVSGEPIGEASELLLIVQAPFWQRPWVWMLGALGTAAVVALGVRRVTQQRMQRRLEEMERQRSLENERARIAQDIHDELGAGLAQIAMLSELAQMDSPAEEDARRGKLDEIGARAQAAGRKLDEIVWAINPAYDSAEDLVGYLARFAQNYLSLAGIRFRLDAPTALPEIGLSSGQRHQVFLAAKEAIHNAVKHGSPDEITLKVRLEEGLLLISVRDDGCGFWETQEIAAERGSASMRGRMEKLGGRFHRESRPGAGTCVTLTLPHTQNLP